MWSLRQKPDGQLYLTFDRERRYTNSFRGIWEFVCKQDATNVQYYLQANADAGYWCMPDDEGSYRLLILE